MAKIRQTDHQHQQLELRVFSDVKSSASVATPNKTTRSAGREERGVRSSVSVEASEQERSIYLAITAKYFDSHD